MENAIRSSVMSTFDFRGLLAGLILGGMAGLGTLLLVVPRPGIKTRPPIDHKSSGLQEVRNIRTIEDSAGSPPPDTHSSLRTGEPNFVEEIPENDSLGG